MKITKVAGKTSLTMSHQEWEQMGKTAGWMDIVRKVTDALGPERTNPHFDKSEHTKDDETGAYQLTPVIEEQEIVNTQGSQISVEELREAESRSTAADPDLVLALHRAIEFISDPKSSPKTVNGMKMVLNRFFKLRSSHPVRKQSAEILKKWYQQKKQEEAMWQKPKNPYIEQLKSRGQKDGWMDKAAADEAIQAGEELKEPERVNYTFGTTPEKVIRERTLSQTPAGYPMHIKNQTEWAAIAKAVNQGIDSHLEGFTRSTFDHKTGKCLIHPEEMTTFLRRLAEIGGNELANEEASLLRTAILETLGVEEI
jgi:hypothetical protein